MKRYYLLSLKWSKREDRYIWWGPNGSGYTQDLNTAGVYEVEGEVPLKWHNQSVVAIPVETAESALIQRVVPATSENWNLMNVDLETLKHF